MRIKFTINDGYSSKAEYVTPMLSDADAERIAMLLAQSCRVQSRAVGPNYDLKVYVAERADMASVSIIADDDAVTKKEAAELDADLRREHARKLAEEAAKKADEAIATAAATDDED